MYQCGYLLDSNLSTGLSYLFFEQPGPGTVILETEVSSQLGANQQYHKLKM